MSYLGVPDILVTVFAYLHVISAMSWLGAAILFVSTLFPAVRKMSPPAFLEFLATVGPRMSRFFAVAATSTVVFGPFLLLTIPDYSPVLYVGIATGLAAYIEVLLEIPVFGKIFKQAKELTQAPQPGPLPADFRKALRHARLGTITTVLLLTVTLMFMVYSGYPF